MGLSDVLNPGSSKFLTSNWTKIEETKKAFQRGIRKISIFETRIISEIMSQLKPWENQQNEKNFETCTLHISIFVKQLITFRIFRLGRGRPIASQNAITLILSISVFLFLCFLSCCVNYE